MINGKERYPVRNSNRDFLQDEDLDSGGFSLGSCDNCGCNLYEDDSDCYCEQCEWLIVLTTSGEAGKGGESVQLSNRNIAAMQELPKYSKGGGA